MESNPSSEPVINDDRCYICQQPHDQMNNYLWAPMKNLRISRRLCIDCGRAFEIKTKRFTSLYKHELHSAYKRWENLQWAQHDLSNRQQTLPGV